MHRFAIYGFADLPDGRVLCVATKHRTQAEHWFLSRFDEPDADNDAILMLEAVLTTGGEIDHLVVGRLDGRLA